MVNIVTLFPLTGNGGIASWASKYLAHFTDDQFNLITISNSPSTFGTNRRDNILTRLISGYLTEKKIEKELKSIFSSTKIDILHATTSGNIGSYRDVKVAKLCKKYGVKSILHCHYGCITYDLQSKGMVGKLLRQSLLLYDQVWVLDSKSYNTLKETPDLKDKVRLAPNPIEVKEKKDLIPKEYNRVAFIGNLVPSKGIFELVEACTKVEVRLDIVGPGPSCVIDKIKDIAGDLIQKSIFIHGLLPNSEAVKFMKNVDILALPTYYPSEAFPISILEAMSLSKMVISCPRAAITDILTGLDGKMCGILVEPKSVRSIVEAINWLQNNKKEADNMCVNAYDKVFTSYRQEIIYELYKKFYKELL